MSTNTGIPQSGAKQPKVCMGIWVRTYKGLSVPPGVARCAPLTCRGPPHSHHKYITNRSPFRSPSTGPPRLYPWDHALETPAPGKHCLYLTWLTACQTTRHMPSTHRGLCYTRPVLQDWESEAFQLIHRNKHRKSYKMRRQRIHAK